MELKKFLKEEKMKNVIFVTLLVSSAITLTACHTVSGVGKDVEATGHALEHAAEPTCCCPHCLHCPKHVKPYAKR